jgi:pimeloyl-ACP methyl ester carboxylesterase
MRFIVLGRLQVISDSGAELRIPQSRHRALERPVVVAVHGGPGLDHMTVKSALGPLAEDFQVLYFDLRGHGRSDHSSAEFWNMRTWADDLRRLCDALGLRKPVVLGSSFGGFVALTYAALFPPPELDPWSVLDAVRCPALVLAGEDDPVCPLPVVEELAGRLPAETTRFVRLPGARHTIFRDRPDLAFPAVKSFVSQVRESQPAS